MPLKKTIIAASAAILLLLLALLALWALNADPAPLAETTAPAQVQVLFDYNHTDDIRQITAVFAGKESLSMSRGSDGWQITGRPGLPLEGRRMDTLLGYFQEVMALRTIREGVTDLAEYGLDQPTLTLTLSTKDGDKTYLFGDENSYYEGYYCMLRGSDTVYLLDYRYVSAFDVTVEELLELPDLPVLAAATQISWRSSAGALLSDPQELQTALATLEIDRIIDYGSEQFAVYGLDQPATAEISFADGKSLTLHFCEGESEELIYLTVGEDEIICLVSCEKMDVLLNAIRYPAQ